MKKQRKHYTPEEKVAVLRRHLLEKEAISKLCDELGLQPTVFYRWQKVLRERGGGLGAEEANQQLGGSGADRLSGKEDPNEGRGLGRVDGRVCGSKKTLGEL